VDLVGRKLAQNGGRALRLFSGQVGALIGDASKDETLAPLAAALHKALEDLQAATQWLMRNAMMKPDNAGAASTPYLNLMGAVAMGYMWLRMAKVAGEKIADAIDPDFYRNKLTTARYFFSHVLPETSVHRARVEAGADAMMALAAEAF
jgi:acyl-CoA dehydrogenase